MKQLSKKYYSNLTISTETMLNGIIVGNVSVSNSSIFVVKGTIIGDVIIEKNSKLIMYGTLNGNIHNYGICEIYGTINGELFDSNQNIFIDENAKIVKE